MNIFNSSKHLSFAICLFSINCIFGQSISSFTPKAGASGSSCTLTVTAFSRNALRPNIIRLGGVQCPIVSQSLNTQGNGTVIITIPEYTNTARFVATNTNNYRSCISLEKFIVKFPSAIGYNYGAGSFQSPTSYTLSKSLFYGDGTNSNNIEVADISGDGKPDVLVSNGSKVTLFTNTSSIGTISFTSSNIITNLANSSSDEYRAVLALDFDNDGDLDIVTKTTEDGGSGINNLSIYANSSGSFTREIYKDQSNSLIYGLSAIDLDRDGYIDLMGTNTSSTTYWYFGNSHTTTAWSVEVLNSKTPNLRGYDLDVANLGGDSRLDLIVGGITRGYIIPNNTGTSLAYSTNSTYGSKSNRHVISGDLDNDGDDDIISGNGYTIYIYQNNDATTTDWSSYSLTSIKGDISLGDLNNDGYLDIVATNRDTINIFINSGSTTLSFTKTNIIRPGLNMQYDVKMVDFDGDGYLDLIGSYDGSSSFYVSRNNLSNTYTLKSGKEGDINTLSSWEDAGGNAPTTWASTKTFALDGSGPFTFSSGTSTWNVAGNVVLNSGEIKLGGTTSLTHLELASGTFNLNGHSLTISGTLTTNSGAKFAAGTSAANQTGSQLTIDPSNAFTGNLYFDENANTFQKIVIGNNVTGTFANSVNLRGGDGSTTPGILEVENGGTLAIASGKKLTLKSGQINAMLSLPAAATGILSGDIAIERAHLGARGWRIYTHPFNSSIDLTEMADDIEMIGSGGTAGGFYSDASTNSSAYYYDYSVADPNREDLTATDLGWKAFTKANDATNEPWRSSNPIIVYNCGAVRNGDGFFNPWNATHQDGIVSLDYTVDGTFNVNDGGSVSVNADPDGLWYYLCNPYTAPVKVKDITNFNSTNVEDNIYYWRQRRASMTTNNPFKNSLPADWQAIDWSTADNALSIPANGAILIKLKSSAGITFTFNEDDKQLSDFSKIIGATLGGGTGYSNWNDMFTEIYEPSLGDNSFLLGLNVADSAEVDNVMIFDVENISNNFEQNDGIKYKNDAFPNIYTVSNDNKALANDKQNITQRLLAGEASVEIPLVITNKQDLPYNQLTLFVKEYNSDLVVYLKDNKTNETTSLNLWDRITMNFEGDKKAPIEKYSLVFELKTNSNKQIANDNSADILVFPNPADGIIQIKAKKDVQTSNFEIYDLTGRLMKSGTLKNDTVNVKDLAIDQYIIKMGPYNTRFIKK